jgi:prolyl-tRNA editing enzyme YbaK/EbsC (Cys-tRNA(Pro) deacylase)
MEPEYVLLGGGTRAIKIKVDPSTLLRLPNSTLVEGLAKDAV